MRMRCRLRPGAGVRAEAGVSLVETLITMVIASVLFAVTTAAVMSFSRMSATSRALSDNSADLRLTMATMSRAAIAADAIATPGTTGNATYVEFHTSAVAAGRAPFCTQWRYDRGSARLEQRTYDDVAKSLTPWTLLAGNVLPPAGAAAVFAVDAADGTTRMSPQLTIDLTVQRDGRAANERGVFILPSVPKTPAPNSCSEVPRP